MTNTFLQFRTPRPLIGVVHLGALPGSPDFGSSMDTVLERARSDARAIVGGGMDGIIVENFGDAPFYPTTVPPETVAAMTRAVLAVIDEVDVPVGINVLRNDPHAALAIAAATGAGFIRVNVHVGAAWTDQGLIVGRAHQTVRLRDRLAPGVGILADVAVKHATPVTPRPLAEEAADCLARGRADAIVVTGAATGAPTDPAALTELRRALPEGRILVGSGVTSGTVADLLAVADGAIVGTFLKEGGRVTDPVDPERVRDLVAGSGREVPHAPGR